MKTVMSSLKARYEATKQNSPLIPSELFLTTGIILTVLVGMCLTVGGIYLTFFKADKAPEAVEVSASQIIDTSGGVLAKDKIGGSIGSSLESADADCPKVSICNGVGSGGTSDLEKVELPEGYWKVEGWKDYYCTRSADDTHVICDDEFPFTLSPAVEKIAPAPAPAAAPEASALSADVPVVAHASTTSETFQAPKSPEPSLSTEAPLVVPVPAEPVAPATPAVPAEETPAAPEVPQIPEVPVTQPVPEEPVIVPVPELPIISPAPPPLPWISPAPPVDQPPVIPTPEAPAPTGSKVIEAYCPADVLMINAWYHPDCAVSFLEGITNSGMTPTAGYVIYRWSGPNDGVERSPLDPAWAIETVVGQ